VLAGYKADYTVSKLTHREAGYFYSFEIEINDGQHWAYMSPGSAVLTERFTVGHSWPAHLTVFREWTQRLKREIEEPDLWASIESRQAEGLKAFLPSGDDQDRFSDTELKEIRKAIGEIQDFLVTAHQLNSEDKGLVELRLRCLSDAASRLGRTDWKNIALSTLISIVLYLSLPPDAAGELFRFASVALRHILAGTTLLK
jgi:hypothetical protein